jgi:hypothetical protein
VHKDDEPLSDSAEAIAKGDKATTQLAKDGSNAGAMFRYNPGKQGVIFPPKHPYSKATPANVKENLAALASKGNKEWVRDYKREIYKRPLSEQYSEVYRADGGGTVVKHLLVDDETDDYKNVLNVAKSFANQLSKKVEIMPEINIDDKDARAALLKGIKGNSNPDLRINEKYFEVKTPQSKAKTIKRIIEAGYQEGIPVITDNGVKYTNEEMNYYSKRAFNDVNFLGDTVWWLTDGNLTEIKKR